MIDVILLLLQFVKFVLQRFQSADNGFADRKFKLTVPFSVKFFFCFFNRLSCNAGVNVNQILNSRFIVCVTDFPVGVCYRSLEFADNRVRIVISKMLALTFSSDFDIFFVGS